MCRLTRPLDVACRFVQCTVLAALVAISLASAAAAEELRGPLELQRLLLDGDYDTLEEVLAKAEASYLEEQAAESVVSGAYAAFASVNPAFEPRLAEWAAAYPASHRPFLADGIFQQRIGWVLRGSASINYTTDQQLALMRDRFVRAAGDFKRVLQRKPELGLTYSYLIGMLMTGGEDDAIDGLLEAGLAADPHSYSIRSRYLYSLTPWWGGDRIYKDKSLTRFLLERFQLRHYPVLIPAEMLHFVERIKSDAETMPSLKPLLGYIDYTVAETLIREGRRQEADLYYRRANEIAGGNSYLSEAAANLYYLDRDDEALEIFDRLLESDPYHESALLYRARIYRIKKDYEKAHANIDRALALSPNDPDLVREKSKFLFSSGRREEAIAFFDNALVYGEFNPVLIHARGMMHLDNTGGKNTKAEDDLWRAAELLPTSAQYWFDYGKALSWRFQCSAIDAYQTYIDVCPHYGNRCRNEDLAIALNYVNSETNAKFCFGPSSPA